MRALGAVRSTELESGAVKLSTMILDILVICPMGLYPDFPMYAAPQSTRILATCWVAGRNLPLALCNSCTSWFVHLSSGRIYKSSCHPMSSHVIPCHPVSSRVIPCHPISVSRFNIFNVILTDLMTDVSSHRLCLLQEGWGLFIWILCCTSGFKGNLMLGRRVRQRSITSAF